MSIKKILFQNVQPLLFILVFLFCSCQKNSDEPNQQAPLPDFTKLNPGCFIANSSTPQLTRDSLLSGSDWNDPSVLKVNDQFIMYASSDQNFNFDVAIYRLTSPDGIQWTLSPSTPVFSANPNTSAWDHRAVETPSVIFFNGLYHLFYTAYPVTHTDSYSYKIGHATSIDGINWTRDSNYLLAPNDPTNMTPNLTFNQWITAEPAAVVFQNKIYLYFTAVGANLSVGTTLQVIGLTTSSDGQNWSTPQSVLIPDQTLYPRSTWLGYSTPNAVVLNNQIHLFFDVVQASPWKQLKLHHAYSNDGVSNWHQDTLSIFNNSSFSWTSNEIRSPSVVIDGLNLHLWFAGDNGTTLGIGSATCRL